LMTISKKREGFTLVELLVVIAIIGTLVGLLLPAVQQAREAARRSACTNNTKQLGLACLNYESTRKRLPAANDRSGAGTEGWSWVVHVLPFIEEVNLYNNLSTATGRFSADYSALSAGTTKLPQLICPSSTRPDAAAGSQQWTNYKGCAAAGLIATNEPSSTANFGGGLLTKHTWSNEQTLRANTSYGGLDIRMAGDGMSKTVMVGEVCGNSEFDTWARGASAWITPSVTTIAANGLTRGTAPTITKVAGRYLSDAGTTAGTAGAFYDATARQGLGSFHTGNLILHAYGDGHTSAISADVDAAVLASIYTRDNGEAVAELP
ncbi:MAG: DUF1559 domain-containing protein, partial [Planctomycetia bacterium]